MAKKVFIADPKREAQIRFILEQAGVEGFQAHDECMRWAFGKDAWELAPYEWAARWNKKHPRAIPCKPNEKFVEFVYYVGWCYRSLKQGPKSDLAL